MTDCQNILSFCPAVKADSCSSWIWLQTLGSHHSAAEQHSVTEGPITLCAQQLARTHLKCGELPQFYTVHAVPLCQFRSCTCGIERTKSKTNTEPGPTMLLGVIWIKHCLLGLGTGHCTEKCKTWVRVSILRKELTNANISGRPGCQKPTKLSILFGLNLALNFKTTRKT